LVDTEEILAAEDEGHETDEESNGMDAFGFLDMGESQEGGYGDHIEKSPNLEGGVSG
jgi:hypothetical protein